MTDPLRIKRLTATATLPQRAEAGSVGYDLHLDMGGEGRKVALASGQRQMLPTGIAVAIPPGCYGRVAPRSGLAAKYGFDVMAGVIDPSYRGEVRIIMLNTGDEHRTLTHGERVAQLIVERCELPEVVEVDSLDETERGAGGFGSSGA